MRNVLNANNFLSLFCPVAVTGYWLTVTGYYYYYCGSCGQGPDTLPETETVEPKGHRVRMKLQSCIDCDKCPLACFGGSASHRKQ
ncbi:hypothetical protein ACLKA6_008813 [Drosophila palustris]